MLTLGPEPGARLPPPPPPPQPMLCFLHFPSTRLSCSFSAPFSLLPTCLPLHSFIFRCCFYFPAILSLLLSSAFQGLILAICAPWPLWPWLSLPTAQNPCPAAQGSTSPFWGHMGYLSGPSTWVPVLFVPMVRQEPGGWFPISTSPFNPLASSFQSLWLTVPLHHFFAFLGTMAIQPSSPTQQPILSPGSLTGVFVTRTYTWHFLCVPESLFREGGLRARF